MLQAFADGSLFGRRHGDGPPRVLALHGWGRDHSDLSAALVGLPAVAVDLPGFGATAEPPEPWSTARYAEAVAGVLADLATPAVVAGHSFGGRVAVQLATLRPDAVGGLVLSGVPGIWDAGGPPARRQKPALAYRIGRRLHRWGVVGDERMEALRHQYGSADYRAASPVMRGVLVQAVGERYGDQLARLSMPVELVWGEADTAAPVETARAAAEALAHVSLHEVTGDHFVPTHSPDALRAAIERRLAALAAP